MTHNKKIKEECERGSKLIKMKMSGIELLRRQGLLQQQQEEEEEEEEEKETDERERGEVRTTSRRTRMYGSRIRRCTTTTRRCQRTSIDSDDDYYNSRMDHYHHQYYYYARITRSMKSSSRNLRRIIAGIAATIGVAVAAIFISSSSSSSSSSSIVVDALTFSTTLSRRRRPPQKMMTATRMMTTTMMMPIVSADDKHNNTRRQQRSCSSTNGLTIATARRGRGRSVGVSGPRLQLFFDQRGEDEDDDQQRPQQPEHDRNTPSIWRTKHHISSAVPKITQRTLEELDSSSTVASFPIEVPVLFDDDDTMPSFSSSSTTATTKPILPSPRTVLRLRFMTNDDLQSLVPMCIEEFSSYDTPNNNSNNNRNNDVMELVKNRWNRFAFQQLVYWTLRLKLRIGNNTNTNASATANANHQYQDNSSSSSSSSSNNNNNHSKTRNDSASFPSSISAALPMSVKDPVMLVLCERHIRHRPQEDEHKQNGTVQNEPERVIGMVELSLQPPDVNRNPPSVPVPFFVKERLAQDTTAIGTVQGWVSNLLLDPRRRGRGYSKVLMVGAHSVAKYCAWTVTKTQNCKVEYIFLHADADTRSGKIPQRLYEQALGYELVTTSSTTSSSSTVLNNNKQQQGVSLEEQFAWAATAGQQQGQGQAAGLERLAAIRMIDGIPLLCFCKRL